MALSANTVFEVRGGVGSDTNGGGFVTGATGTDYSQQNSKNSGGTDSSTTDAVAAGTTTITSATASFGTTIVGNIIYLQGGTGSLAAGWYQVVTRASATTITVDRNVVAGTGITMNIGGAFNTISQAFSVMTVANMNVYVKATATYSISTALTVGTATAGSYQTRVIGYNSTRGDNGRPTISVTTGINGINVNQSGWTLENLIITGGSSGLIGVNSTVPYFVIFNVKVSGFTSYGILFTAIPSKAVACEVTGCSGTAAIGTQTDANQLYYCNIHDNTTTGIASTDLGATVIGCAITNNTGSTSDGINLSYQTSIIGCLLYGNGRDGVRLTANLAFGIAGVVINNIFAKNTGYGFNWTTVANTTSFGWYNNNGYWNNGTAATNGITKGPNDVTISGTGATNDPFVSDSTGNFALNSTAGAGALLRAAGFVGVLGGTTGYQDIGPFQHQSTAAPTSAYTFIG
jgi:hypothetical protein